MHRWHFRACGVTYQTDIVTDNGAPIVDAHIHQWDPFTTPRIVSGVAKVVRRAPFLRPLLKRILPRASSEFVGDPRYVLNPYLPADYVADASPLRVDAVVHIEASWKLKQEIDSVDETRWVSALPFGRDGAPKLGGIVVHADPSEPEVAEVLDAHLAASPLVRGVRYSAAFSSDPGVMNYGKSEHVLAEPAFLRGFAAIAERGLNFDLWLYGHQLPDAVTLVREYPGTTFILDHYGTPAGALGPRGRHTGTTAAERSDMIGRWRDDIAALAELPNVVAKHSGFGMPVMGLDRPTRDQLRDAIAPLVSHVDQLFGADRAFWSSNFPMDKPNVSLPDTISIVREILGERFDEDKMLRSNARRVYRLAH